MVARPVRPGLVSAALTALLLLGACGAQPAAAPQPTAGESSAAPPPAPAADTTLTVLCGVQEDWCQVMTRAFEEETDIKTSYVRLSSGEAAARLQASANAPEFSVWFGGPADAYVASAEAGLLEPYVSPNAAAIPDTYKDAGGTWTGAYVGALGFCSNQEVLDSLGVPVPDSWDDLLDPRLKGQVAISHPATSGTAFTTLWTEVTLNGGDVEQAFAYFRQLHNNVLQYTKSGITPGQMAGRGEVAVGIVFSHDCVKFNEEGMSSLVVSFPAEGTGYEIGGLAIIKGAPEPEAAKRWVDWALTPAAQELGPTVKSYQLPTNPDAAVSDKAVKLAEITLVDYDFVEAGKNRKALGERFDTEIAPAPKE